MIQVLLVYILAKFVFLEMAIAILRAFKEENGKFSPECIIKHFLKWSNTRPKGIGKFFIDFQNNLKYKKVQPPVLH
jgi:hypothetical protein